MCKAWRLRSHGVDLQGKTGLAVRGLVLVDDALARGLVQLACGDLVGGFGRGLVAGLDGLAGVTDGGLERGLHRDVALVRLFVGTNALLLRLDVCHCVFSKRRVL